MTGVLPGTMRAVEITKSGGPEVLRIANRPVPRPAAGEVLIEQSASSVNRLDVFQREGTYPVPPGASDIPGLDAAGRIVALGEGATRWTVGEAVCALLSGGGYAEYCTAPEGSCLPIPKGLTAVEAATLPETVFTVWSNVFDRGRLQPGDALLVHGGTSGIGVMAVQMAARLGARVFATAGSDEKCRLCETLGAAKAINYRAQDFVAEIKRATGNRGVDVVLDMVGGDYLARNIDLLAPDGRLVQIALLGGAETRINYGPVMLKRLTLTGSTLRARPPEFKAQIAAALQSRVWPLIEAGKIKPVVSRVFALEAIADAHRFIVGGDNIGKIAVQVRA